MSRNRKNEWYRDRLAHLREEYGAACQSCGETERRLEFAHVKPTALSGMGRGRNARVLDIMRHKDAYTLLCRKCHRARDGWGPHG